MGTRKRKINEKPVNRFNKKYKQNSFAAGKNNQNLAENIQINKSKVSIVDHQTGYSAEVENSIDKGYENIKTNANQSFQSPDKDLDRGSHHDLSSNLASCWKFFEKFKGAHPVTQNICYKVKCKILFQ